MVKKCCFIGHRKIDIDEIKETKLKNAILNLIEKHNVKMFLFGSRSDFDDLCHSIVTDLMKEFTDIKRIMYPCKSEYCMLESERETAENQYYIITGKKTTFKAFEDKVYFKDRLVAGKSSYIERNMTMIDDADFCIFYYDTDYQSGLKSKSGTASAYKYATSKGKNIVNIFTTD